MSPQWAIDLDGTVNAASIEEIRQALPALVTLTESPISQLRGNALLVLYSIASRQKAGLPENRRTTDVSASELIVPYLSRLAPRLTDPATPVRSVSLLLFQALTVVRPVPEGLLKAAIGVLREPQSTLQLPDTTDKAPGRKAPSMGPQMLWVLLPAGATYFVDPQTGITEGRDSPEVREAIIYFLRRHDQTTESISESIRALAVAQAQNSDVNAELLRFLGSPNAAIQSAALMNLPRLTFTSQDFAFAKVRVAQLANDPAMPTDVRKLAAAILVCWINDRHKGPCPELEP